MISSYRRQTTGISLQICFLFPPLPIYPYPTVTLILLMYWWITLISSKNLFYPLFVEYKSKSLFWTQNSIRYSFTSSETHHSCILWSLQSSSNWYAPNVFPIVLPLLIFSTKMLFTPIKIYQFLGSKQILNSFGYSMDIRGFKAFHGSHMQSKVWKPLMQII